MKFRTVVTISVTIISLLILWGLFLFLTSRSAHAQEMPRRVTMDATVEPSTGLGYSQARFGGEVALKEPVAGRFGFSGSFYLDRAQKLPGKGFQVGTLSTLRYYFKKAFVGGGLLVAHQTTDTYTKTTASPLFEIGAIKQKWEARFLAAPFDFASPNHLKSFGGQVDYYQPSKGRVGLHFFVRGLFSHFRCNQTAHGLVDTCTGASLRLGFGLVFKERAK